MPTKKQLHDRWASEMWLGLNDNEDGYNVRGSHMAGTGKKFPEQLSGEPIGHYEYDEENDDIKIVIDPEPPADAANEQDLP